MKRKDGTIIETENTVINLDCDGGWREGVISIIEDITERVRAQEALAERERHYRLLTENQLDVIWAMDLDFNFTYVNAAAENLLGYTPEEAVQMNLRDICSERVFKHHQSIIEEKTIKGQLDTGTVIKTEYLHKDGSIVPVEIHGKTLYEDSGQPTGFQGSTRDISERLHLEAQVRQAQKLESIGTLASGIAHEISNPVHGIKGYAGLIKDIVGENAKVGEYVQQIQEQTEQIHTIVANLLGLARKEEQDHPMEPASLSEIVDATVSLTRTVMRHDLIALNVNVPATLPPILCHKQQIQQVVLNLLTNARDSLNQKYPEGDEDKKIDIIASLRIQSGEQWTRLTIEDHGHGILPEVRERMYEPFYTTKAEGEGTGLGMWIIYSILKDHNANIKVETEEGRYTRFHIDLPTVTEEKA